MIAVESKVEERMPVWIALSELFLDTELQADDHDRIARVLWASPYSEEKIEEILRFEITPALKWNLMSVAGVWGCFDDAELRDRLAPRLDKKPFLKFGVSWMIRDHWNDIARRVADLRRNEERAQPGGTDNSGASPLRV